MLFFEKAISVLKDEGWLGWSVSNTFLRSGSGRTTRQIISQTCSIRELIEFEARKVYPEALIQIVLAIPQKAEPKLPVPACVGPRSEELSVCSEKPAHG